MGLSTNTVSSGTHNFRIYTP